MNKYIITPIKQRFLSMLVTQKQWEKWRVAWKFFFILGYGRSGTNFMANLLDQAHGAHVFHEPVLEDFYAHTRAFYSPKDAEKYIHGFRKKEIYYRMRHISSGVYGEVNGVLRRHAEAMLGAFPGATLIHLVRDGRDVVRSTMSRRTMTLKDPVSARIHPVTSDPWYVRWGELDRFARICWYWQVENSYLRTVIGRTVQFEKILASYEYFASEILEPCGIHMEKRDWEAAISTPRNSTSEFSMPKWDQWTVEQQNAFREICGEEMLQCGYTI